MSIASIKSMHLTMQMQHQEMRATMNHVQNAMISHDKSAMTKVPCQDMQGSASEHHQGHNTQSQNSQIANSHDQEQQDCHQQIIQAKLISHSDCRDCALYACQSVIVWLNTSLPQFNTAEPIQHSSPLLIHYQAQHLAGHETEILRPPKA